MASWVHFSAFLPLLLAITAYFYISNKNNLDFLQRVANGLLNEESNVNVSKDLKVAVGFGSCMDLIVDGIPLLKKLKIKPPTQPTHHDSIGNEKDLAEVFTYFMREGAAAEYVIIIFHILSQRRAKARPRKQKRIRANR